MQKLFCLNKKKKQPVKQEFIKQCLKENPKLKKGQSENSIFKQIESGDYKTVDEDYITIVCLSDTHRKHKHLPQLPKADILIHSGDFSSFGKGIQSFSEYIDNQQQIKWKIVIGGNHEYPLDIISVHNFINSQITQEEFQLQRDLIISDLTKNGTIYLENTGINLLGYNIWGTPFTPQYRQKQHAFQHKDELIDTEWQKIPSSTDILITHSPAYSLCDTVKQYTCTGMSHISGGDPYLLKHIVTRVNPILHQFGHFHNAYGLINRDNVTVHINAAQIEVMKPILVKIPKRSTINNESNIYTSFIN